MYPCDRYAILLLLGMTAASTFTTTRLFPLSVARVYGSTAVHPYDARSGHSVCEAVLLLYIRWISLLSWMPMKWCWFEGAFAPSATFVARAPLCKITHKTEDRTDRAGRAMTRNRKWFQHRDTSNGPLVSRR